jgi:hypothetical protein
MRYIVNVHAIDIGTKSRDEPEQILDIMRAQDVCYLFECPEMFEGRSSLLEVDIKVLIEIPTTMYIHLSFEYTPSVLSSLLSPSLCATKYRLFWQP